MDWSGVDYCDVFIRCLDSHFDGTHSLQRIHWWASDVMLHFSESVLMKKQTHLNLDCLRRSTFQANFHFGWTIPLRKSLQCSSANMFAMCCKLVKKNFFFQLHTSIHNYCQLNHFLFWCLHAGFDGVRWTLNTRSFLCVARAPAEITLEEMQG